MALSLRRLLLIEGLLATGLGVGAVLGSDVLLSVAALAMVLVLLAAGSVKAPRLTRYLGVSALAASVLISLLLSGVLQTRQRARQGEQLDRLREVGDSFHRYQDLGTPRRERRVEGADLDDAVLPPLDAESQAAPPGSGDGQRGGSP
jgi:hypothetical protein